MPLDYSDWDKIQSFLSKMLAERGEYFLQAEVVKNDPDNKLVWVKELGDTPIPLLAFDYQITYYFNEPTGNTTAVGTAVNKQTVKRKTNQYSRDVEVLVPRVGDVVLIAKMMGSRRLPKCLGVIKSTSYVGKGGE
jgi:hypothetical protein